MITEKKHQLADPRPEPTAKVCDLSIPTVRYHMGQKLITLSFFAAVRMNLINFIPDLSWSALNVLHRQRIEADHWSIMGMYSHMESTDHSAVVWVDQKYRNIAKSDSPG